MSAAVLAAATDLVALRALLLGGLVLLVGGSAVGARFAGGHPRLTTVVLPVTWVVASLAAVLSTERLRSTLGVPLTDLADGPAGQAAVLRALGLVVALAALIWAAHRAEHRRPALVLAAVACALAVVGHTSGGHARAGVLAGVSVGVQGLHVVAAGAWLGGLAAIVLAPAADEAAELERLRRFSRWAAVGLVVVVVTGVVRSLDEIGSFAALADTTYGRIVLLKAQGLLALAGLGLLNRNTLLPAGLQALPRVRRNASIEVVLAMVVVVATGVLAETPPGKGVLATRPVEIEVVMDEFSFTPSIVEVPADRAVRLVFVNRGDAEHEAVVGDERVQAAHESGDHSGGQMVTVPPGGRRTLELAPTARGSSMLLGCHLPGHHAQGMAGEIRVVSAS